MVKAIYTSLIPKMALVGMLFLFSAASCNKEDVPPEESLPSYHEFTSYSDFISTLTKITDLNASIIGPFWDSLVANHQIPFIMNDSVALLYKEEGSAPSWAGDFNGWSPSWQGKQLGSSDIYIYETVFPADARLDYKIVDNGRWLLDPDNAYVQYSGFGPNSELRMPAWEYPIETISQENILKGNLSSDFSINSTNLAYRVQYKVYTPYNYNTETNLPVVYVTDGQEYADERLGSMVIVLDNLIFDGTIQPIIAVFIDPRDPDNLSHNRRGNEYTANINYANFVADELVLKIDNEYKTVPNADHRAILGTSLGGWNSAFFGLKRSDVFHLIGIHSPAFDSKIIQDYKITPKLPLRFFMSTGVIHDTEDRARNMKSVLEDKGYPLQYYEVNQGHSWGNWRGMLRQPLTLFFGAGN